MSRSLALAGSACADRCGRGCGRQAQCAQQHLRRLPETRPPGAEVPGGRQAVPSQLLQVITAAAATVCMWKLEMQLALHSWSVAIAVLAFGEKSVLCSGQSNGCNALIYVFVTVLYWGKFWWFQENNYCLKTCQTLDTLDLIYRS